jgi:hypothetical protein
MRVRTFFAISHVSTMNISLGKCLKHRFSQCPRLRTLRISFDRRHLLLCNLALASKRVPWLHRHEGTPCGGRQTNSHNFDGRHVILRTITFVRKRAPFSRASAPPTQCELNRLYDNRMRWPANQLHNNMSFDQRNCVILCSTTLVREQRATICVLHLEPESFLILSALDFTWGAFLDWSSIDTLVFRNTYIYIHINYCCCGQPTLTVAIETTCAG